MAIEVGDLVQCRRVRFLSGDREWTEIDAQDGRLEGDRDLVFVLMMLDVTERDQSPDIDALLGRLGWYREDVPPEVDQTMGQLIRFPERPCKT